MSDSLSESNVFNLEEPEGFFFFLIFLIALCSMHDLHSPTRD